MRSVISLANLMTQLVLSCSLTIGVWLALSQAVSYVKVVCILSVNKIQYLEFDDMSFKRKLVWSYRGDW